MTSNSIGILLQGAVTDWSEKIVKEYQENLILTSHVIQECEDLIKF